MADVKKALSKSFVDNHEDVTEDVAGQLIIEAELKLREIEEEQDADEKFAAAKQIAKDISSAYSAAKKYEKAKIRFLLDKITEIQGGEVNPSGNT
jgi:hypothetical protein